MYNVVECTIITICAVSRKKTIKQKFVMTVGIEPPTPGFKVSCTAPTLFWLDCESMPEIVPFYSPEIVTFE